jgi:very-short-patch-repair endonuclease
MFDMLAERGFRIDTQVPVGNFRIDLVVEGEDDRRLAIECDGDRYHGPEKWPEDMARQRVLERAGWEVWRCFASRFVRDRTGVLDELLSLLSDRGIAPVGVGEGWISRHTEHRRWRTPAADPMVADYEAAEIEADVTGYRPKASDTRPKLEDAAAPARLGETPTTVRETQINGEGAGPSSDDLGAFRLTAPVPSVPKQVQHPLPLNGFSGALSSGAYVLADFAALGLTPDAELLYDSQYRRTLREMVGHVIRVEGPIYGDILAVRIARAHGKERTGSTIQKLVFDAVGNRFPRSREEDREVFWPEGLAPDAVFPHRPAADGVRSHADTPLAELASLALPLLRVRLSDEEVIQKMADHFTLARIRRATRERFEAALEIAKRAPSA